MKSTTINSVILSGGGPADGSKLRSPHAVILSGSGPADGSKLRSPHAVILSGGGSADGSKLRSPHAVILSGGEPTRIFIPCASQSRSRRTCLASPTRVKSAKVIWDAAAISRSSHRKAATRRIVEEHHDL